MTQQAIADKDIADLSPGKFRNLVRQGKWEDVTTTACRGYAQANLVIVPKSLAFEFLLFCTRNPKPCPVIEVTAPVDMYSEIPCVRSHGTGRHWPAIGIDADVDGLPARHSDLQSGSVRALFQD